MEKQTTSQIIDSLDFNRKRPVSSAQKKAYAAMQKDVDAIRQRLNKLHLRLWHAVNHRDYHSLSLEEAREILGDIEKQIDAISKTY